MYICSDNSTEISCTEKGYMYKKNLNKLSFLNVVGEKVRGSNRTELSKDNGILHVHVDFRSLHNYLFCFLIFLRPCAFYVLLIYEIPNSIIRYKCLYCTFVCLYGFKSNG